MTIESFDLSSLTAVLVDRVRVGRHQLGPDQRR